MRAHGAKHLRGIRMSRCQIIDFTYRNIIKHVTNTIYKSDGRMTILVVSSYILECK